MGVVSTGVQPSPQERVRRAVDQVAAEDLHALPIAELAESLVELDEAIRRLRRYQRELVDRLRESERDRGSRP